MDPNETLARIRDALKVMNNPKVGGARYIHESEKLAAAFADLDEWLSKGGFLPEDWERK